MLFQPPGVPVVTTWDDAEVNVKWFGARGDGIHSDSPAFLAAAAALPAAGGTIIVPATSGAGYLMSPGGSNPPNTGNTGVYINRSNVRIRGEGIGSLLLRDTVGLTANMFWLQGDNNVVEGCHFDQRDSAQPHGSALVMGGDRCTVNNNTFENSLVTGRYTPRTAAGFTGNNLTNFRFTNNISYHCQHGICGLGKSAAGILIQGNKFLQGHEMGISIVGGGGVGPATSVVDVQIVDNYVENSSSAGIYVGWDYINPPGDFLIKRVLIARNIVLGSWTNAGIFIRRGSTTEDIRIIDNIVDGADTWGDGMGVMGVQVYEGFGADTCAGLAIEGNQIRNVAVVGIDIHEMASTGMVVSRNVIRGTNGASPGHTGGLWLKGSCRDLVVNGNVVTDANGQGLQIDARHPDGSPAAIRGVVTNNTFINAYPAGSARGIGLSCPAAASLDLRVVNNILGDNQGSPTQAAAINWASCVVVPTMSILDNDVRPFGSVSTPAPHGSWTVR